MRHPAINTWLEHPPIRSMVVPMKAAGVFRISQPWFDRQKVGGSSHSVAMALAPRSTLAWLGSQLRSCPMSGTHVTCSVTRLHPIPSVKHTKNSLVERTEPNHGVFFSRGTFPTFHWDHIETYRNWLVVWLPSILAFSQKYWVDVIILI